MAEEAPAAELFAKVAEEVAGVFGQRIDSAILRYEADDAATVVAVWGEQPPGGIRVGARLPLDGSGVAARVFRERRPVRVDDYATADGAIADHAQTHGIRSAVGCPILVRGRVWGAMVVAHYEAEPFPAEAERRVSQFTELVATGIANAEARAELQRLADEQAALRRVATLVAEAAAPAEVFDAVIGRWPSSSERRRSGLMRSESSHEVTIVAQRGQDPASSEPGCACRSTATASPPASCGPDARRGSISTRRGSGPSPTSPGARTSTPRSARRSRSRARLWGVITASWEGQDLPPVDAEERLAEFAELLDTAIANADSRDQLTASRARVLTAGDDARRRVVRDLHDGAQQRLVHTIVTLKLAQRAFSEDPERAGSLLAEALDHAEQGNAELRELAHGILPAVLTREVCGPASTASSRDSTFRSHVDVTQHAAAARDRGERLLHRGRGADQRRQALAGDEGGGDRRGRRRHAEPSRCATTASAGPTRRVTGCWASATARPHSAGGCGSTAPAAAVTVLTAELPVAD